MRLFWILFYLTVHYLALEFLANVWQIHISYLLSILTFFVLKEKFALFFLDEAYKENYCFPKNTRVVGTQLVNAFPLPLSSLPRHNVSEVPPHGHNDRTTATGH